MRRLSFLLRPGWLVLAALVLLFAYLCFSILAPWQLGKNSTTSERNDQIARSFDADPVPVSSVVDDGVVTTDEDWRQVFFTGSYIPDSDVVVRLRSVDGAPTYDVLTPFRTDTGDTVIVNRGYVLPIDGNAVPDFDPPPTGTVALDGRARVAEGTSEARPPITDTPFPQVYTIAPSQVGPLTGTDPIDGYVQLSDDQPGGLGPIALPQLDAGPYLSYGLQWLAFGLMAPLGLAYFVRAEIRERRRDTDDGDTNGRDTNDGDAAQESPDEIRAHTGSPDGTDPTHQHDDGLDALLQPRRRLGRSRSSTTSGSTTPASDAARRRATDPTLADRYGSKR